MESRKFISVVTFFGGLPGLAAPFVLLIPSVGISTIVLGIFAFFLRGVAGVAGSVGLWQGKLWGYKASACLWLYLFVAGIISLFQVFTAQGDLEFQLLLDPQFKMKVIAKAAGHIFWGSLFSFILLRDILKFRMRQNH